MNCRRLLQPILSNVRRASTTWRHVESAPPIPIKQHFPETAPSNHHRAVLTVDNADDQVAIDGKVIVILNRKLNL